MYAAYEQWEKRAAEAVHNLLEKEKDKILLIAIDGQSGSGKSTLAGKLHKQYGGNLFHMDDFFLRPEQRTKERLEEVGGNVDYERFAGVLQAIRCGEAVPYRPYDCKSQSLKAEIMMEPSRINMIEGSYSMHPCFGDCYDLKIVLTIDGVNQQERILHRNGPMMLTRFIEEWIPKENAYLEKFKIYENCDIKIDIV